MAKLSRERPQGQSITIRFGVWTRVQFRTTPPIKRIPTLTGWDSFARSASVGAVSGLYQIQNNFKSSSTCRGFLTVTPSNAPLFITAIMVDPVLSGTRCVASLLHQFSGLAKPVVNTLH